VTSDHAWVQDHLLEIFLHPIAGEDEFGELEREATAHSFIENYREAQSMPAAAARAYLTCVEDVLAREHYVGLPNRDEFERLVFTLSHASDIARHACEGVATAIAEHNEFSGLFDMKADAAALAVNLEADASAAQFNVAQDGAASQAIPSDQGQDTASAGGHDEHAGAAPAFNMEADAAALAVNLEADAISDEVVIAAEQSYLARDPGAAAGPFDPAHTVAVAALAMTPGHDPHPGAAAGPFDPANDQAQNAAQPVQHNAEHQVYQQTQHAQEPGQQGYDHGGHDE
jgi:hypothetical protein